MPRPCPVTKEQADEIVARYVAGETPMKLSKEYGTSERWVTLELDRRGVQRRGREVCKANIRHDAFADAENDPAAAYWVGFLMADGCVTQRPDSNSFQVVLVLAEKDAAHVQKLADFVGSKNKILDVSKIHSGVRKWYKRFAISSKEVATDLARYGILPRKSLTAKVEVLEDNPHFWRGMIDGDGSLMIHTSYGGTQSPQASLIGSLDCVTQFCQFVNTRTDSSIKPRKAGKVFDALVTGWAAYNLIRILYGSCDETTSLNRKREKADHILQNVVPKSVRRKPGTDRCPEPVRGQLTFADFGVI